MLLIAVLLLPLLVAAVPSTPLSRLLLTPEVYGFGQFTSAERAQIDQLASGAGSLDECQSACALLSILNPGNVSIFGTAGYTPIPYWSVQQFEVTPACRLDATSATSISKLVKISKLTNCPFAVKSGGHVAFAGGSSIQNGMLVNLAPLNQVTLNKDRTTASVGPGNTWYDVYIVLDAKNLSVVGGREAGVGVGGLTLGGGISYFSGRYGWACDNVKNYELVLANGSIINVSPSSHSDMYFALRGGSGSNFGIVTRFDFVTFEQGLMWGGSRLYSIAQNVSLIKSFYNFVNNAPQDNFAHNYIAFGYGGAALGGYVGISGPVYGKPEADPPIFAELDAIPSLVDATSITNMSTLAVELNQTAYQRQMFRALTFKNGPGADKLMSKILDIFIEESQPLLQKNISGYLPTLAFQPISLNIIAQMQKNGGNALGVTTADGPLVIQNMDWGWDNEADDEVVLGAMKRFQGRCNETATATGLGSRYVYLNYAALDEPVYAGYGDENLGKLKTVKQKYDPENVFGRLWPGYFKL
ncbi:FAD-binding domain-containing protein [Acephala macrosclerotiorum]|nr:FAD-binding domain-containing protein [Acephala macrosclerotiorum]